MDVCQILLPPRLLKPVCYRGVVDALCGTVVWLLDLHCFLNLKQSVCMSFWTKKRKLAFGFLCGSNFIVAWSFSNLCGREVESRCFSFGSSIIRDINIIICILGRTFVVGAEVFCYSSTMTEYILLILYFSSFICLCALVCLYFSGCQEMTYKHDGKDCVGFLIVRNNVKKWTKMLEKKSPEDVW